MGCWGYGILESDDAMDIESELNQIAGIYDQDDGEPQDARAAYEHNLDAMLKRVRAEPVQDGCTYDRAVAHQVLAILLMLEGCTMTAAVRDELIAGALSCNEYGFMLSLLSETGERRITREDLERHGIKAGFRGHEGTIERLYGRQQAIDNLVETLRRYRLEGGTPERMERRGLLDVLAARMSAEVD